MTRWLGWESCEGVDGRGVRPDVSCCQRQRMGARSGHGGILACAPRLTPWAAIFCPFGAGSFFRGGGGGDAREILRPAMKSAGSQDDKCCLVRADSPHGQVHRSFALLRMTRDICRSRFLVAALARNDKVVGMVELRGSGRTRRPSRRELLSAQNGWAPVRGVGNWLVAHGLRPFDFPLGFARGFGENRAGCGL